MRHTLRLFRTKDSKGNSPLPDHVLRINGKAAIAIEAKKLGAPLGAKEAAQVVAYCSNLGVRWGAVTDGRHLKLYDAPMLGVPPHERQVLSVDLSDYKDRDDFEARIYPELQLIRSYAPEWSLVGRESRG
jgi:predicted type IV restriction endonuclease